MRGPVCIAGPTASGKSAAALLLAERVGGEIISVDSMQVYKGLDIGTAKPTTAEQARVRHHLIDILEIDEQFDAAQFPRLAVRAEGEIRARGKAPIYCGGTGLYFNALAFGVGTAPPGDPALRGELEGTPLASLLEELRERDPAAYERIDRGNPRRVIRAVEVIRLTGKPFSEQKNRWDAKPPAGLWLALGRGRADLHERINRRVDAMFAAGLVDETKALLAAGLERNPAIMQAIGYRQVVEHLRGERGVAETIELVKARTRQFARRQLTWFKRQLGWDWIEIPPDESPAATRERILEKMRAAA